MASEIQIDLTEADSEIRQLLSEYISGQPGKITLDFITREATPERLTARISSIGEISTPGGESSEGEESEVTEESPSALLVIARDGEAQQT